MACAELEALRLALTNVTGDVDDAVCRHAENELEGVDGPVRALAEAETLEEIQRHLDAALVELEEAATDASTDDPDGAYLRGRLVAVRDAERRVRRLCQQTDALVEDLGAAHHTLHDAFPVED
jgi:hypothetical protein